MYNIPSETTNQAHIYIIAIHFNFMYNIPSETTKQVFCFLYFLAYEDLVLETTGKHYQSSESPDQGKRSFIML